MELGETDADAAFGAYPFDPSAVGVNVNNRWPVSKRLLMAHQDTGNRALPPSPPPLIIGGGIGPSASANWPPSRRREEARALSNLEKRVGSCRVRNTSSFKMIPIVDEKDREERNRDKESSTSLNSNKTEAPKGLDNRPQMLRKIYTNRPLSIINDTSETDTEWYTSEFITECLCWHNVYRQRHGAPTVSMCPDLCSYAQEWANTLAHLNTFYYRPNSRDIGQNVYCRLNVKEPSDVSGQEVASYWYSACRQYDYLKEPDVLHANVNAGPFTQLIWASSCDIGIGIARSRTGKVMVVANYRPPGNISGQFQENVLPPLLEYSSDGSSENS